MVLGPALELWMRLGSGIERSARLTFPTFLEAGVCFFVNSVPMLPYKLTEGAQKGSAIHVFFFCPLFFFLFFFFSFPRPGLVSIGNPCCEPCHPLSYCPTNPSDWVASLVARRTQPFSFPRIVVPRNIGVPGGLGKTFKWCLLSGPNLIRI